ncbi:hypothetical protein CC80DRAFT_576368 [Byssothecium circinans]|uniref:Uncharacterized protein n=1 Tax=Byssothecium circinans TaxID=147558 RepID=A0A6A5TDX4_9PLEO|nr:hypothetical protein CC80DRAFT_576368 [Byssothecium circinans]
MLSTRINWLRYRTRTEGGIELNRFLTTVLQPPPSNKLGLSEWVYQYKFCFVPGPRQYDPVLDWIEAVIRDLNRKYIHAAASNFRVYPTDDSTPIWPPAPDGSSPQMKMYTFIEEKDEFPATCWVTLMPRSLGSGPGNIHVKVGGTFIPIKDWLLFLIDFSEDLVGKRGAHVQRKWWRLNAQHFRLMDLPFELRAQIYVQALGPVIYPHRVSIDISDQVTGDKVTWGYGSPKAVRSGKRSLPNVALLRTSRQVYKEAMEAGWQSTIKGFTKHIDLCTAAHAVVKPQYNWLQMIRLDFSTAEWFDFFGNSRHQRHDDFGSPQVLGKLPGLRVLQMVFHSIYEGWSYSPWSPSDTNTLTACQRTIVDWIMVVAFPHVKVLPSVTLLGAVKAPRKKYWDQILQSEYQGRNHEFDQEKAVQDMLMASAWNS